MITISVTGSINKIPIAFSFSFTFLYYNILLILSKKNIFMFKNNFAFFFCFDILIDTINFHELKRF